MTFRVVSLFSGAGGLSKGFAERFSIEIAVDTDQYAVATYEKNFPLTTMIQSSVEEVDWDHELAIRGISHKDIDIIIGGPPCQGFSKGNSQTRDVNHPLNHLWRKYLKVVKLLQPTWFVMENVPGMRNINGNTGTVSDILQVFKDEIGYHVEVEMMLASDFGVPQKRKRIVFVGSKEGYKFPFPKPLLSEDDYITVEHAICGDLPPLQDKDGNLIEGSFEPVSYIAPSLNRYQQYLRSDLQKTGSHITVNSSEEVRNRWRDIPPGGNWADISEENKNGWRNVTDAELARVSHSNLYKRLDPSKPSITIANFRRSMICHPVEDRIISIREAARLQSFPDDHFFVGPKSKQQQMVANAVPPLLAKALADQLFAILNGEIELETEPKQLEMDDLISA